MSLLNGLPGFLKTLQGKQVIGETLRKNYVGGELLRFAYLVDRLLILPQ